MRAKTVQIHWHGKQPIFSCHFDPRGNGRLATAGADHTTRIWRITKAVNSPPDIEFLSSLTRHTAGVNVVRFAPQGEILASAGDDGNIILWKQTEHKSANLASSTFACGGEDSEFHKETWRVMSILRGSLADIFDLAWSPDGRYIITGSVDNTTIIWDARDSKRLHVFSYHTHFVQGVAWDPKGQYFATQSSDRSVHVYDYHVKPNGQFTANLAHKKKRMPLVQLVPEGRKSPPSTDPRCLPGAIPEGTKLAKCAVDSPDLTAARPSATSPQNPEESRSSFQSAPSTTQKQLISAVATQPKQQARTCRLYADETLLSFFRRLTFAPDGSFLFTPAGEFNASSGSVVTASSGISDKELERSTDGVGPTVKNTVYIYSRAGICGSPVAHLPGHPKPAIAVACSPLLYKLRETPPTPERLNPNEKDEATTRRGIKGMLAEATSDMPARNKVDSENQPGSICKLPHRCVFAVATQDSVVIYDTQQAAPLVAVGNMHYASLTDLAWSPDGCTLIMTSVDGFCSIISFEDGELGQPLAVQDSAPLTKESSFPSNLRQPDQAPVHIHTSFRRSRE